MAQLVETIPIFCKPQQLLMCIERGFERTAVVAVREPKRKESGLRPGCHRAKRNAHHDQDDFGSEVERMARGLWLVVNGLRILCFQHMRKINSRLNRCVSSRSAF